MQGARKWVEQLSLFEGIPSLSLKTAELVFNPVGRLVRGSRVRQVGAERDRNASADRI